jgi:hypothetical protein
MYAALGEAFIQIREKAKNTNRPTRAKAPDYAPNIHATTHTTSRSGQQTLQLLDQAD